ncbi:MAG: MarR family winged helix-turn-helix transcriptional regulator [Hyphomicrobiales bacterium]|nr:MarR family winged helix-turn-helix transcriptional regulator [Hyphomicrobiales bacterium]
MAIKQPSKAIETVWERLFRAHHFAFSRIEADLKKAGLPPLGWYDALLELERAGDCGLRPYELEQRLLLPQYGLSRLLQRLEHADYVKRWRCEGDGRGQVVSITQTGCDVRARMQLVYAAALQDVLGKKLNNQQADELADLLARLLPQ